MSNKVFYKRMSDAISKLKNVWYDPDTVRSFMRNEKIPHYFTYELLVSSIEDVYTSYIHDEQIDEMKRQLAQDRWESNRERMLKVLADLFEGKNLAEELKAISPLLSDDSQYTRIVVSFIKGNWPDDSSDGLTLEQTDLLRTALEGFLPAILKIKRLF